ncbi:putative autotransporter adhesin-like protein [Hephaestia caeni]|uniref:Putative autotransporter adhesin-like protein n=1 Tax=Hephaestia caeni TaxID=645617 RepID=A0A397P542_9SPHN|nr:head GIN domain-containing protein [Hephaestia caeni]RIA44008.1 putative autotransporter adhesin-like protein [Hephaestia caeni]
MRLLPLLAMLPLVACSGQSDATDATSTTAAGGDPVTAQGTGTSRNYDVTGFDQIDLRGPDDVDVRVGAAFAIQATGPADLLDKLEIVRDGDTLKVGRRGNSFSWGGEGRAIKIMVTMPAIRGASVAGSGNLSVDRVEGDDFAASASGSGDMTIGAIKTRSASFSVAGSGDINAAGTTGAVKMNITGSGDIDAERLAATTGNIAVQGSGEVEATVTGNAKVSVTGSGDVEVHGGAKCDVSKMGSGDVRCG